MGARQIHCPYGRAISILQLVQEFKRLREFFGRCSQLVQSLGYCVGQILGFYAVQSLGYYVVLWLGYYVEKSLGFSAGVLVSLEHPSWIGNDAQSSRLGQYPKDTDTRGELLAPGRKGWLTSLLGAPSPLPSRASLSEELPIRTVLGNRAENPTLDAAIENKST